jgi:hypothetical protein
VVIALLFLLRHCIAHRIRLPCCGGVGILNWISWWRRSGVDSVSGFGCDGGLEDVGSAERAVDVRAEPGVDAGDVERVAALGQQAHELAVLELAEADGAVRRAEERRPGAVPRRGDGVNGRLVQPHGPDVPDVVDHPAAAVGVVARVRRRGGSGGREERLPPPPPHLPAPHGDRDAEEDQRDEDNRGDGDESVRDQAAVVIVPAPAGGDAGWGAVRVYPSLVPPAPGGVTDGSRRRRDMRRARLRRRRQAALGCRGRGEVEVGKRRGPRASMIVAVSVAQVGLPVEPTAAEPPHLWAVDRAASDRRGTGHRPQGACCRCRRSRGGDARGKWEEGRGRGKLVGRVGFCLFA